MVVSPKSSEQLIRGLGLLDATMLVVGSMVGSGIFLTSAESGRLVNAPGWLLVAWALAGVMTISGALCCAELAAMMPRAGGQYVFLREAYGPLPAFLFGWSILLIIQSGTIAAVALAFASFLGALVPQVSSSEFLCPPLWAGRYAITLTPQQLVAVLVISVLTLVNTTGLRAGKLLQNVFTIAKFSALLALIVLGLTFSRNAEAAAFASSWWNPWKNGTGLTSPIPAMNAGPGLILALLLGKAMVGPLFSQSAWNNVTFAGEEIRDPGRNLPVSLLLGCGMVAMAYVLANLAYTVVLTLPEIQHAVNDRVATVAMASLFGWWGSAGMAIAIMVSTFGCANGLILAGARVAFAMARDGLFFKRAATLNASHVPQFALIVQGIWAAALTLPRIQITDPVSGAITLRNVYTQLLEYVIAADLVFYCLMVGAVIVLRIKRPDAIRPYRAWAYPLAPLGYLLLALLLIAVLAVLAPLTSGVGYAIVLSGVPVYLLLVRAGRGRSRALET
jgi:APA family basic amino acid/polyamine antiporter